jgi:hypothetical protein
MSHCPHCHKDIAITVLLTNGAPVQVAEDLQEPVPLPRPEPPPPARPADRREFIPVSEAAERCGWQNVSTYYRNAKAGKVPAVRRVGGLGKVSVRELEAFLGSRPTVYEERTREAR